MLVTKPGIKKLPDWVKKTQKSYFPARQLPITHNERGQSQRHYFCTLSEKHFNIYEDSEKMAL